MPTYILRPTAVVTGASSGIGAATAVNLIENGWNVCMIARSFNRMKQMVSGYDESTKKRIKIICCDITNASQIISACSEIKQWNNDHLNLLLNNAGALVKFGSFVETISIKDWDTDIALNLRAPFIFTQQLISSLKNASEHVCHYNNNVYDGTIINISSATATDPSAYASSVAYCVAKSGLNFLTKLNASELSRYKIRVNSVVLGCIPTNIMYSAGINEQEEKALLKLTEKAHVIGRNGTVDDVIHMIHFLCNKKQSGWITGENIGLNGGWNLHGTLKMLPKL